MDRLVSYVKMTDSIVKLSLCKISMESLDVDTKSGGGEELEIFSTLSGYVGVSATAELHVLTGKQNTNIAGQHSKVNDVVRTH